MMKRKKYGFLRLIAICTVFLLVVTSSNALLHPDELLPDVYTIIVETDQEYYYQGETVYVTGQLQKNGEGIAGGYCPKVLDPENNTYWDPGACFPSEPDGTFAFDFDIGSMFGTYTVCVHGMIEAWEGYENKTIEAVSGEVVAEANGPYEGTVEEPIQFYGDVTGGKPPYKWHWDFGDEATSEEQNPSYTYDEAGGYIATLTVTDSCENEGSDTADVIVDSQENLPPDDPEIEGETDGKYKETYNYTIVTDDPEEQDVKYVIEWGDDETTETEYYSSGEEIVLTNSWDKKGTYTIRVKAIDEELAESGWTELEVSMPVSHSTHTHRTFFFGLFPRFSDGNLIYWSFGWKTLDVGYDYFAYRGRYIIFGYFQN